MFTAILHREYNFRGNYDIRKLFYKWTSTGIVDFFACMCYILQFANRQRDGRNIRENVHRIENYMSNVRCVFFSRNARWENVETEGKIYLHLEKIFASTKTISQNLRNFLKKKNKTINGIYITTLETRLLEEKLCNVR